MGTEIKSSEVRYITYTLGFPDGEIWVDQTPMIHDLYFTLDNSTFRHNTALKEDLLKKGECFWRDKNKVQHHVKIENEHRPRVWGSRKGK